MERPPVRPTSSGCPSGIRGPPITGVRHGGVRLHRRRRPVDQQHICIDRMRLRGSLIALRYLNGIWCRSGEAHLLTGEAVPADHAAAASTRSDPRCWTSRTCSDRAVSNTTRGARHDPENAAAALEVMTGSRSTPLADLSATDHGSHGDDRGRNLLEHPAKRSSFRSEGSR
jgi:hypothetical protein